MTGKNRTQSPGQGKSKDSEQLPESGGRRALQRGVAPRGNVGSLHDLTVECSVRRICHGHTFISHLLPLTPHYLFLSQPHQRAGEPSWVEGVGR